MRIARVAGRFARAIQHEMFPSRESAALRAFESRAGSAPRYTPGRVSLAGLDVAYVDAASTTPQWNDIFVRRTLDVTISVQAPRVLDCGANIGLASLWLKRRFPDARITAFEADPAIADVLRQNLSRNAAGDVDVVAAAVWTVQGTLPFRQEGADSGALNRVAADTPGEVVSVPTIRLADWLREPVHLLKLDIEGAELDVLVDCVDLLHNVSAIQMEVHDFDPSRRLLPDCLRLLDAAGFVYALDDFAVARWRAASLVEGPFPHAVPSWVVLVRAWRRASAA